jgi:hypothetical protein
MWCVSINTAPNYRWPRSRDAPTAHRCPLTHPPRLGNTALQHAASPRTPGIEQERIPLKGDGIWRGLWVQRRRNETAMLFSLGLECHFGAHRCSRAITSSDRKAVFLRLGVPLLSTPCLHSAFAKEWGTIPLLGVLKDTSCGGRGGVTIWTHGFHAGSVCIAASRLCWTNGIFSTFFFRLNRSSLRG